MKPTAFPTLLLAATSTALSLSAIAQENPEEKDTAPAEQAKTESNEETNKVKSELELLSKSNSLRSEQLKEELAEQQEMVEKLKVQKELLATQVSIAELKSKLANHEEEVAFQEKKKTLEREVALAKIQTEIATQEFKAQQAKWNLEKGTIEAEISTIKAEEEREAYLDTAPVYLDNPLQDDGTLVISDRRIAFNGAVTSRTADHITSRIHFFNNQNPDKPIFIVIDSSPGGSVMAGYRILKAMEASDAPIHVVVKSFAASMAASITTLAEHSYAYPNAIILHHQINITTFGRYNLTEQRETYEDLQEWWKRLASPIAKKMGISNEEFVRQMYEKNSNGDWVEFADKAKQLNWIDHIVERIEETSTLINPDNIRSKSEKTSAINGLTESLDNEGRACIVLPRLNPKDVYFLHNPDHYYRLR